MALVKFETTSVLDMALKSIQQTMPNCNTNAAAAKHAIRNYLKECEANDELSREYQRVCERLRLIEKAYRAKKVMEEALDSFLREPELDDNDGDYCEEQIDIDFEAEGLQ